MMLKVELANVTEVARTHGEKPRLVEAICRATTK